MENQRQKELLTTLECVNYKKSSQQLPSCVMATRDSLFCKMCSPLFCFEQEKVLKNFSKKLYTNTIKKIEEAETKNSVSNFKNALKLAQIVEPSSGTRQVCVSVYFLFWSLYKTNRFHVAVGLFSNRSQRTSKCGKNNSDTLACGSCATSLFLPHFDVICDLVFDITYITRDTHAKHEPVLGLE